MNVKLDNMIKPDGSKKFPARTCQDIIAFHPDSKSGYYWVDPNKGCIEDAIKVKCEFKNVDSEEEKTEIITCVDPSVVRSVEKDNWPSKVKTDAEKWFVEDHQFGKIEYKASMSQLTYLGYLNREATQSVTIHCKKSPVWFDNRKDQRNYNKALAFRGLDDQEYRHDVSNNESRFSPKVIQDDCQYHSNNWKQTKLEFSSHKFIRLPITDFAPVRDTDSDAMFGIDLGPVCFKN